MPKVTYLEVKEPARRTLTPAQVATMLNLNPHTLQRYRLNGKGPVYIQISATAVVYEESDVYEWMDARKRRSTSDKGAGK